MALSQSQRSQGQPLAPAHTTGQKQAPHKNSKNSKKAKQHLWKARTLKSKAETLNMQTKPINIEKDSEAPTKPEKVSTEYPKKSEELSANWKALQAVLNDGKKGKKRKKEKESTENPDSAAKRKRMKGASASRVALKIQSGEKSALKPQQADTQEKAPVRSRDLWFSGVDPSLLDLSEPTVTSQAGVTGSGQEEVTGTANTEAIKATTEKQRAGLTRAVAMDCEMVGTGFEGRDSQVARVSLVNAHGHCVYDAYVRARQPVTDFRTHVSGVTPAQLKTGERFEAVQRRVADILAGRVLVGHALHNDLKVLELEHPRVMTRDTQLYAPFRELSKGRRPALRKLADELLGVQVHRGQHSSIEDAQVAMRLYTMHRQDWERSLQEPPRKQPAKHQPAETESTVSEAGVEVKSKQARKNHRRNRKWTRQDKNGLK